MRVGNRLTIYDYQGQKIRSKAHSSQENLKTPLRHTTGFSLSYGELLAKLDLIAGSYPEPSRLRECLCDRRRPIDYANMSKRLEAEIGPRTVSEDHQYRDIGKYVSKVGPREMVYLGHADPSSHSERKASMSLPKFLRP